MLCDSQSELTKIMIPPPHAQICESGTREALDETQKREHHLQNGTSLALAIRCEADSVCLEHRLGLMDSLKKVEATTSVEC